MPLQDRFEATSEAARRMHPSSDIGGAKLVLDIHPEPAAAAALPEYYGEDSFEFLVVDPEYAFASWEVSPATLAAAERELGAADFAGRMLQLRLYPSGPAASGETAPPALTGYNLFGDCGRWFMRSAAPGRDVTAVLGFAAGTQFYELARRGPVSFPRNAPVEAERYAELHVDYERGPQGQLILAGLNRPRPRPWPATLSPAAYPPIPLDYLDGQPGWGEAPGTSAQQAAQRLGGTSRGPGGSGGPAQRAAGGQSDV
jgi:hypothetical protein